LKICRILPAESCSLKGWDTNSIYVHPDNLVRKDHCIVVRCSGLTAGNPTTTKLNNKQRGTTTLRHNANLGVVSDFTTTTTNKKNGTNTMEREDDDDASDNNEMDVCLFFAPNKTIRDDTIQRWKLIIARFAALAVMEDADAILNEYFVTTSNNHAGPPRPVGNNFPIHYDN
jgi:hypothetical protein